MDWYSIVKIIQIIILLGLVIFVHELGHFLVARWCGVKVERFSIGFGPILFAWRWGETEYALSAVPVGGYVKMLGANHEMPETDMTDEERDDERSFQNKSVGARMAIISAGVIMNVLFAFVCFVIAFRIGLMRQAPVIGRVIPGMPAWKAGLEPGDKMVAIDGRPARTFETLVFDTQLARPPYSEVEIGIERDGKQISPSFRIKPQQEEKKPMIGAAPGLSLQLNADPVAPKSVAASANLDLVGGETVLAVDDHPVHTYQQFEELMWRKRNQTVVLTVAKTSDELAQSPTRDEALKYPTQKITLPPAPMRTLGLKMQMGQISAIQAGSPAEKAGVKVGDTIKAVDDQTDLNPVLLPEMFSEAGFAGKEVKLKVLREKQGGIESTVTLSVKPRAVSPWVNLMDIPAFDVEGPMGISALGVAYRIQPAVGKVTGPPASKSKPAMQEQDEIQKVKYVYLNQKGEEKSHEIEITENHWPSIFWAVQFPQVTKVVLTVQRGKNEPFTVEMTPQPVADRHFVHRGLQFSPLMIFYQEPTMLGAVSAASDETKKTSLRLYLALRGMIIGTLSAKDNVAGPLGIASVAYSAASQFGRLMWFMGLISINLAVVNFLPIPVLDGGHMVFLLYELVTRRRPSEKVHGLAMMAGLLFIVLLMIVVLILDIGRLWATP